MEVLLVILFSIGGYFLIDWAWRVLKALETIAENSRRHQVLNISNETDRVIDQFYKEIKK